jgi:hypothetical protein
MLNRLKHLDFLGWLYGLFAAIVGGGSSAVTAAVAVGLIDPEKFNLSHPVATLQLMLAVFVLNGLISMFLFLKQSPLPAIVDDTPKVNIVTGAVKTMLVLILIPCLLASGGCQKAVQIQLPQPPDITSQIKAIAETPNLSAEVKAALIQQVISTSKDQYQAMLNRLDTQGKNLKEAFLTTLQIAASIATATFAATR